MRPDDKFHSGITLCHIRNGNDLFVWDNVYDIACTGVDIISIGAITHSIKAFDISMKIL